ncbi:DUF6153 family protein [Aeromicrobium sp. HA]|uniref:DUF6153 family protein n=1 Tax=unclassified Aeromicrobium TaxID=2633570 RepID=UPI0022AEE032|nr:DUF6153 family protein [Aeromicrobium sp. HA]
MSVEAVRSRGRIRFVLLGGLLVAGVIVGLLGMHTLNLHGTPAAQAPAVAHAAHDVGEHLAADAVVPAAESPTSCVECAVGGHLGMAMACVLALLLVLLVLALPRLLPSWLHRPWTVPARLDIALPVLSRAPSLHALCISRT